MLIAEHIGDVFFRDNKVVLKETGQSSEIVLPFPGVKELEGYDN